MARTIARHWSKVKGKQQIKQYQNILTAVGHRFETISTAQLAFGLAAAALLLYHLTKKGMIQFSIFDFRFLSCVLLSCFPLFVRSQSTNEWTTLMTVPKKHTTEKESYKLRDTLARSRLDDDCIEMAKTQSKIVELNKTAVALKQRSAVFDFSFVVIDV